MPSDPLVYISVLNWNRPDQTLACLKSLESLEYDHYHIVVVDNASQDDSVALLSGIEHVSFIQSAENRGYAGGHQLAAECAQADGAQLLWILNNDLTVQPDTLRELVTAYQAHPSGIYGSVPLQSASITDIDSAAVQFPRKYFRMPFRQQLFVLRPYDTYHRLFPERRPQAVASLSGASLLIPLRVIEQYGFMDTSYFLYLEEVDYCFRLRQHNIPSIVVPTSIVFHRRSQSSEENEAVKCMIIYYRTRNQLLFIRRYNASFFFVWGLLRNIFMFVLVCLTKGRSGRRRSKCILRGSLDAISNKRGKTFAPEDAPRPG